MGKILLSLAAATGFFYQAEDSAQRWQAKWIAVPGAPEQDYGVYHFRKSFELSEQPEHFRVYVSGDNRYQLFVNGTRVAWGPARGDLTHWRYEIVDLGPHLHTGLNVLAAVVWNDGAYRALAQITNRTGFILQVTEGANEEVNTNRSWRAFEDKAYRPQPLPSDQTTGYYALAANEHVDGQLYPWGWESIKYSENGWAAAEELTPGALRDAQDAPNRWMLVPREIPLEEQKLERFASVRRDEGIAVDPDFLRGTSPVRIPAHSSIKLLLDQSHLTTAYPELRVSGGKGAAIDLRYAETLFISRSADGREVVKGNRNVIEGKQFFGPFDTFVTDGGPHRLYRPLFWRTYRYLELDVRTSEAPLELEDLHGIFTGYPFERTGAFTTKDSGANEDLQRILDTGWRTARLCAHETYMDCPFYEQLQYGGDARIQMLISVYMTGDARLMQNGISLLNSSRTAEGATFSRAPSYSQQYIPPFSLWWIGMVHDYWMYVDDSQFVKEMMPGVHAILEFYARYQQENGSLRRMPWWNFVDWAKEWPVGVPPANPDGVSSAALDLQLLLAYGWAVDLEKAFGSVALASEYSSAADRLKATILTLDWDENAGLFADQPAHESYSQQVNTLAVLAHVGSESQSRRVVEKIIAPAGTGSQTPFLVQSTIYFRAYTNAALREAGMGDRYLDMLGPWHEMLADGLTTWAEWNGPDSRSDCHAWGASPNYELLRTVAGIDSMAPGFKRVRVAPNPGRLEQIEARIPHPKGFLEVKLDHRKQGLSAEVDLPIGVDGEFVWAGEHRAMHPGRNQLKFP
jgi:hypothetical protein